MPVPITSEDESTVDSPCYGVCKLDTSKQFCIGCLRTLNEIGEWRVMDNDAKQAVIDQLKLRRQQMPSSPGKAPSSVTSADGSPGSASRG